MVVSAAARAEVIDDDRPPRQPDKTPVPKPNENNAETKDNALNINEPGFKATVIKPQTPLNTETNESTPEPKNQKQTRVPRIVWSLPQEDGAPASPTLPDEAPRVSADPNVKEDISPELAKAIAKERSGKPAKEMVERYAAIVKAEPESPAARYRLGLVLVKSGELIKGLDHLEKAVELQPQNPRYLCDYGLAALQANWLDRAMIACQAAATAVPSNARYQSALGDCLLSAGRVEPAVATYTRAISLEPDNADYVHNLALAYLHGKNYRKALEIADEAIKLKPKSSAYYCTRGIAKENNKAPKEAIADYTFALALDRQNAYAHFLLANMLSDPEDPTYTNAYDAIEHAAKAVTLTHSKNAQFIMGLARALVVGHEYEKAVQTAQQAVALEPREDYRRELARLERLKKDGPGR
jgi:tetratricopeptide (TPR) repeat protein